MKIHKQAKIEDHVCGYMSPTLELSKSTKTQTFNCCSKLWKKVTCKNCLKTRKLHENSRRDQIRKTI